jgi:hypothetical protein
MVTARHGRLQDKQQHDPYTILLQHAKVDGLLVVRCMRERLVLWSCQLHEGLPPTNAAATASVRSPALHRGTSSNK